LTGIPISIKRELIPEQLGNAVACFPLAGLVIGGILAGLNWLLDFILPQPVTDILLIGALVIITGAVHLDGLSDTCDGIAGHKTIEERWQVMHDSRTGAFGVVGIVLVLLAKYVTLGNVPSSQMTATLLFMPVVSRWAMVYAIFAFPYARPSGLGLAYKQSTRWIHFIIATFITVAVAGALFPLFSWAGLLTIPGIWILTTALSFYFKYKFRGNTGDTYGAINEVSEVSVLLLVIIICQAASGLV
jgi:adenosylcobinamide-GDP ribazoletransferase